MVQPCWIALCRRLLEGTSIKVCSAMAYPMGGALTRSKVSEMRDLVEEGVDEVDFMPNLGLLLSANEAAFRDEKRLSSPRRLVRPVKAMLELETLSPADPSQCGPSPRRPRLRLREEFVRLGHRRQGDHRPDPLHVGDRDLRQGEGLGWASAPGKMRKPFSLPVPCCSAPARDRTSCAAAPARPPIERRGGPPAPEPAGRRSHF